MKSYRQFFVILNVLIINVVIIFGFLDLSESFTEFGHDFLNKNKFIFMSILILIVNFFGVLNLYRNTKSNYAVAIIGFPKSGKTTILMTLFDQILSQRLRKFQARIQSDSGTIERVATGINKIRKLEQIPSSEDSDVYAYRTLITKGKGLLSREFRVEFGDFPGEQSIDFVEKYGEWFHKTPYFQWINQADAFIFIIDCGKYLAEKLDDKNDYVHDITTSFLAAWQHLLEANPDLRRFTKSYPILVIFNKSDLIYNFIIGKHIEIMIDPIIDFKEFLKNYILNFAFNKIPQSTLPKALHSKMVEDMNLKFSSQLVYPAGYDYPSFIDDNKSFDSQFEQIKRMIEDDFKDILNHFQGQSKNFKHSFVSSFEIDERIKQENFEGILSPIIDTSNSII